MLKPVPGRPGAFVDEAGQVFVAADFREAPPEERDAWLRWNGRDVGPCLTLAHVRARFPKAPLWMGDKETAREVLVLGLRVAWAAFHGRFHEVCVYLVRLKELVEEIEGKPFNHGDHWT